MFDIQFVIPCSFKEPYKQRIFDFFNNVGLFNLKHHKIKVFLLVGTETVPEDFTPLNVEVEIVSSKTDQLICKVYEFFSNMTEQQALDAKWTAKIDDDTYNDIDKMVSVLSEYNHEEKYYIVPGPQIREDLHRSEHFCIEQLFLTNIFPNVYHELEGCWISKKFMHAMVTSEKCKELFDLRKRIKTGYTDQCIGVAASILKVAAFKEKRFYAELTHKEYNLKRYQNFCHIHPVSHDKNYSFYSMLKDKIALYPVETQDKKLFL